MIGAVDRFEDDSDDKLGRIVLDLQNVGFAILAYALDLRGIKFGMEGDVREKIEGRVDIGLERTYRDRREIAAGKLADGCADLCRVVGDLIGGAPLGAFRKHLGCE